MEEKSELENELMRSTSPKPSVPNGSKGNECEQRETRITKENLYMVLALWMEEFPVVEQTSSAKRLNKVGVVFVLPTDRVLAADCSRDGVHGVARVMVNHCGKLEGCKVFVSRKPCSHCAKLLVQSKVSRVFYLPIEPESEKEGEIARADNLFKNSSVGQSVFVPCVEQKVLDKLEDKLPKEIITPDDISECRDNLLKKCGWSAEWFARAQASLPWPCFEGKMKSQVDNDFKSLIKWIAVVKAPMDKGVAFPKVKLTSDSRVVPDCDADNFPDSKTAYHMMIFAKMLARQTDDPKTGVGAVIVRGKVPDIVSLGWNGFPSKALYGEFPRASDDDRALQKKFPYVIHAEQNALMVRNVKDLTDGILFVTKPPCDECAPMIKLSGVKTIVIGEKIEKSRGGELSYNLIKEYIKEGIMTCYQMEATKTKAKRLASDPETRKRLKSSCSNSNDV